MQILGSWCVEYDDGTYLTQYDEQGGERPFRAIEWARARTLKLESQFVTSEFSIVQPPAGYSLALRSRTVNNGFHHQPDAAPYLAFQTYMLCTFDDSQPIDPDRHATVVQACVAVTYWTPNGVVHQCPDFDCRAVSEYCSGILQGEVRSLPQFHEMQQTGLDLSLV